MDINCSFLTSCLKFVFTAWNALHSLMGDVSLPSYNKLKKWGFIVFIGYSIELFVHLLVMYMICSNFFQFEMPIPCIYAVQQFFPLFVLDLFIGFFSLTCFIVIMGLRNIQNQVESCLQDFDHQNAKDKGVHRKFGAEGLAASAMANLRIQHERYCEVIRLLQKSFGIQVRVI